MKPLFELQILVLNCSLNNRCLSPPFFSLSEGKDRIKLWPKYKSGRKIIIDPTYEVGCVGEGYFPDNGNFLAKDDDFACTKSFYKCVRNKYGLRGLKYKCPTGYSFQKWVQFFRDSCHIFPQQLNFQETGSEGQMSKEHRIGGMSNFRIQKYTRIQRHLESVWSKHQLIQIYIQVRTYYDQVAVKTYKSISHYSKSLNKHKQKS